MNDDHDDVGSATNRSVMLRLVMYLMATMMLMTVLRKYIALVYIISIFMIDTEVHSMSDLPDGEPERHRT
jgi:hypothetical protein